MFVSLFKNNETIIGVDYRDREDCIAAFDLRDEDILSLENGATIDVKGKIHIKKDTVQKSELCEIERKIEKNMEKYLFLKELGNYRSNAEEKEFLRLDKIREKLLPRRQELLNIFRPAAD